MSETLKIDKIIRDPLKYNLLKMSNHTRRYHIAIERLNISKKDKVIDASCGEGYGSYILSKHASKVYGVDVDKKKLTIAYDIFGHERDLWFVVYDVYKKMAKFIDPADKIVCIETIEHVQKKETKQFVEMLLSFLKPGGDMFLTTPIGNNKPSKYNKYHLNELSIDVLYELFRPNFSKITIDSFDYVNSYNIKTDSCYITMKGKY
jgi:cyclopropane fatty-acyl-phospholipid synthase-like methyltransferase